MTSMTPAVVRALEDLLRRVLRSTDHGIDPLALSGAVRTEATARRHRRELGIALALAAGALLVPLGWFLGGGGRTG